MYNKRAYGQRIQEIEHASFTLVVVLATGGLAHEATYFYKCLASLLSHKWGDEFSVTTPCCGSSTNGFSDGVVVFG